MSTTQRWCRGCRQFGNKFSDECEHCGTPRHAHNKWLVTAQLNNHLYQQAANAK